MLLVFLMAAMIAISLYLEIPRIAMETQRAKEQLLIDRGEQYKRAIYLFYKSAKRYPAEIKDLENFQNKRFLRHRYVDPMTGKDEWRLIHIQNGILTDSLVNKQGQSQQKEASNAGQFVGEQVGLAGYSQSNTAGGGGAVTMRNRARPSDGATINGPPTEIPPNANSTGMPNTGGNAGLNSGMPAQPGMPGGTNAQGIPIQGQLPPGVPGSGAPGTPGAINGFAPGAAGIAPGGLSGRVGVPGAVGTPSNSGGGLVGGGGSMVGGGGSMLGGGSLVGTQPTVPVGSGQYPGGMIPGQTQPGQGQPQFGQLPGQPGPAVNSQTGGVPAYPTNQGANGVPPGFPQPGTQTGAPNNAAADLIRNILTTPRPGGMPQQAMGGQVIGGGIAGVASTAEGEGVKVYNDRTLYGEWEFIFDPQKIKQIPNPNQQGLAGTPASQMGNTQGMGPAGQPVAPGMNPVQPGMMGGQPGLGTPLGRPGGQ